MIEAVKAVLVEEIYGVCNGVDPVSSLRTFCGDNEVQFEFGEQCDDGNNFDGDGCSSRCMIECDTNNPYCNSNIPVTTLRRPSIPFTARKFMQDV
jgi:cysteine-rich repeat protein